MAGEEGEDVSQQQLSLRHLIPGNLGSVGSVDHLLPASDSPASDKKQTRMACEGQPVDGATVGSRLGMGAAASTEAGESYGDVVDLRGGKVVGISSGYQQQLTDQDTGKWTNTAQSQATSQDSGLEGGNGCGCGE